MKQGLHHLILCKKAWPNRNVLPGCSMRKAADWPWTGTWMNLKQVLLWLTKKSDVLFNVAKRGRKRSSKTRRIWWLEYVKLGHMVTDCGSRGRTDEPAGNWYKSMNNGSGRRAAFLTMVKCGAQISSKLNAVGEPRSSRNQKIIIEIGVSEHVDSDVNLFTRLEQIKSSHIELANAMVMTSSGKESIVLRTGSDSFSLGAVYYTPSRRVKLTSSRRVDEKGVPINIMRGICDLYHRADSNNLLMSVPRREMDGLLVGYNQLPRKLMSASVGTEVR